MHISGVQHPKIFINMPGRGRSNLPGRGRRDIGLRFVASDLSPPFCRGIIFTEEAFNGGGFDQVKISTEFKHFYFGCFYVSKPWVEHLTSVQNFLQSFCVWFEHSWMNADFACLMSFNTSFLLSLALVRSSVRLLRLAIFITLSLSWINSMISFYLPRDHPYLYYYPL